MKANEFLQAMDGMDNGERIKLLSALYYKHFDNGVRPNPYGDTEVNSVTESQLEMLRNVVQARSKKDHFQTSLEMAKEELHEALFSCKEEGIPQYIVNLVLNDDSDSGAKEILSEYGIEVK